MPPAVTRNITDVSLPQVSFRHNFIFQRDDGVMTSDWTMLFRSRTQVADSLAMASFVVQGVRDAPDGPCREFALVATKERWPLRTS